ncbi:MAG: ABC transporter substrate-binding protein [Methanoculleus sp.]
MIRKLLLLAVCTLLLAGTAAAIPCDRDGDGTLTASELATAILDSLDARFMGGTVEAPPSADLRDAAFIYEHWDGKALTITDTSGQTTTLTRPLRRIALFNSDTLEMLRSIDLEPDRIVGVSKYTLDDPTYFPEYQGKANLGSVWSPDYEQAAAARPDAVFLYASISQSSCDEIEETLRSIDPNILFFRFDSYMPAVYADEVQKMGLLLGKKGEAERFLAFHGSVMDTVAERIAAIPADDQVSVYLENWVDYKSAGKGSGYDEKIELAGGKNIFGENPVEYPVIDPEAVISRNPDVIIKIVGAGELVFGGMAVTTLNPSKRFTVRSRNALSGTRSERSRTTECTSSTPMPSEGPSTSSVSHTSQSGSTLTSSTISILTPSTSGTLRSSRDSTTTSTDTEHSYTRHDDRYRQTGIRAAHREAGALHHWPHSAPHSARRGCSHPWIGRPLGRRLLPRDLRRTLSWICRSAG